MQIIGNLFCQQQIMHTNVTDYSVVYHGFWLQYIAFTYAALTRIACSSKPYKSLSIHQHAGSVSKAEGATAGTIYFSTCSCNQPVVRSVSSVIVATHAIASLRAAAAVGGYPAAAGDTLRPQADQIFSVWSMPADGCVCFTDRETWPHCLPLLHPPAAASPQQPPRLQSAPPGLPVHQRECLDS